MRDDKDRVDRIVEQTDATAEELEIDEINTSIYCFRRGLLAPALRRLSPENAQGEYYLTDVDRGAAPGRPRRASRSPADDRTAAMHVNDRAQLAAAEAELRARINLRWMREGVSMVDPAAHLHRRRGRARARRAAAPGHDPRRPHRRSAPAR